MPERRERFGGWGRLALAALVSCAFVGLMVRMVDADELRRALARIGPVDLLFLPVGGRYTIDAKAADEVLEQLHPALVVPMHYRTGRLCFELEGLDGFLAGKSEVYRYDLLHLTKKDLAGAVRVAVLSCPAAEEEADR